MSLLKESNQISGSIGIIKIDEGKKVRCKENTESTSDSATIYPIEVTKRKVNSKDATVAPQSHVHSHALANDAKLLGPEIVAPSKASARVSVTTLG